MSKGKAANVVLHIGGKAVKALKQNSDVVMMILGWLGLIGTAGLAVKATVSAVKLCESKEIKGKKEIIRTTWRLYVPAIGCFIVTTMSIAGLGWHNIKLVRKLATVTGLYAMKQEDFKALQDKAKEVLGEKKEQEKVEDEVTKERLEKVVQEQEKHIIETGHGNKLFMERLTGQLIRTSPEHVEAVSSRIDNRIHSEVDGVVEVGGVYLQEFNLDPNCWVGSAIWDMAELLQRGVHHFEIDCREIQWMTVNGQQEMVGIISPPDPTGV